MNNKKNKGGRRVVERKRKNPKLDPAINRYSVNFSSEEDMRFLKMFDRSGMTASPHSSKHEYLESLFMW